MLEFKTLNDIQRFTADKNRDITCGFSRIPKYGEWELTKKISLQEYGLLCLLYEYLNTSTGKCYPSHATLLSQLNIGESSIQHYLRSLETAGLIRRISTYKVTKKGKRDFTSSEIIIVPIEYVDDPQYHMAVDKFIEENRYVVIVYGDKGRKTIGTGKKNEDTINACSPEANRGDSALEPVHCVSIVEKSQPCVVCESEKTTEHIDITSIMPDSIEVQPIQQNPVFTRPPAREKPTATEEELQLARNEFQVLYKIPGIPAGIDIEREIEKMVELTRKHSYKPGYGKCMEDKILKLMTNPYNAARPENMIWSLRSDYITDWIRRYML